MYSPGTGVRTARFPLSIREARGRRLNIRLRDRSNRSLDTLPCAFKCRESPDRLTGLPVNFIRYYPDKFGDYIALRPVKKPNALPPI